MKCPHCNHDKFVVKETRLIDGDVVRRRQCGECGGQFGTRERIDPAMQMSPRKKQVRKAPKPTAPSNPLFGGVWGGSDRSGAEPLVAQGPSGEAPPVAVDPITDFRNSEGAQQ